MLIKWLTWAQLNVLNVTAFSILGLLFVTKPSTLVPSVVLLLFSLAVLRNRALRAQFANLFMSDEYAGIARAMLVWFGVQLLLGLLHSDTERFYFPDNALRMLMALVVLLMIATPQTKTWFICGMVVAGFAAMCWAIYQWPPGPWLRAKATTNNPIYFGNLSAIVMMMAVTIALLVKGGGLWLRIFIGVAAFGGCLGAMASMSRSSFAVVLCVLPLVVLPQSVRIRRWLIGGMLVLAMLVTMGLAKSPTLQSKLRIHEVVVDVQLMAEGNHSSSLGARVSMWQAAWQMFKEKPLLGFGQRAFPAEFKQRVDDGRVPRTQMYGQPHSDVLHAMSSGGVLKLSAYLGLLIAPWLFFYRHYKTAKNQSADRLMPVLGMQLVAAYFLFGLMNSSLDLQIYSMTYAVLVCLLAKLTCIDKELAV